MIECEHFIYSLATGLITTANIEKLLTPLELDFLCHIGDKTETENCFRTTINPHIVAITYVKPVRDDFNRRDVWNHTILINYKSYFEDRETKPVELVAPYLIQPTTKLLENLEPLKI